MSPVRMANYPDTAYSAVEKTADGALRRTFLQTFPARARGGLVKQVRRSAPCALRFIVPTIACHLNLWADVSIPDVQGSRKYGADQPWRFWAFRYAALPARPCRPSFF